MPGTDVRATIVRGPLQNVSLDFKNGAFVADQIFPILDIDSPKAKIWKWDEGAMFRDEAAKRAPGTSARMSSRTGDWVNVDTYEYAFGTKITDEDRRYAKLNSTPPMLLEQEAMEFMANKIDLKKEALVANAILTGTWADGTGAGGEDVAGLWAATDSTNTLQADINLARRTFLQNVGMQPGLQFSLLIDRYGLDKMLEALALSDYWKYTSSGVPSPEWLKNFLSLDRLIIGETFYDAGQEKKAGGKNTITPLWQVNANKGCAFAFVSHASPKIKMVAPGMQVRTKYDADEGGGYRKITAWRDDPNHQDMYDTMENLDIKQIYAGAGYMFKDIVAT